LLIVKGASREEAESGSAENRILRLRSTLEFPHGQVYWRT
jgi:hypothetical protein